MKENLKIPELKYRIKELLYGLSRTDYTIAIETLPQQCGVHKRTFYHWINIKETEHRQIPAETLLACSEYFDIEPKHLLTANYKANERT